MGQERYHRPITIRIPRETLELIDWLVEIGVFLNRAEAVRYLLTRAATDYAIRFASIRREGDG